MDTYLNRAMDTTLSVIRLMISYRDKQRDIYDPEEVDYQEEATIIIEACMDEFALWRQAEEKDKRRKLKPRRGRYRPGKK